MKLILKVPQSDGYTYSYDRYCAFEAAGKEEAEIELLDFLEKAKENGSDINFHGHEFNWRDFYYVVLNDPKKVKYEYVYDKPEIFTLDELFEHLKA
jgi:hypothetical protein